MAGDETKGVNDVDVSPATVAREWDEIEKDEKLDLSDTGAAGATGADPVINDRSDYGRRLAPALGVLFGVGFAAFAPAWRVTVDETKKLADTWGQVLVKYLPVGFLSYIPDSSGGGDCAECDALAATVEVVSSRLGKTRFDSGADPVGSLEPSEKKQGQQLQPQQKAMVDIHGQS